MYLNTALRRQEEKAYTPTAKDLGLGPYILMFHLLLMHWKKLVPERGITYRRMLVKDSDCRRYQKGTQFIWMSFVSSSVDLAKAEPFPTCAATGEHKMTFIIDNRNPSRWRPRNIENHAQHGKTFGAAFNQITTEEELEDLPTFHYQNSDVQLKGLGLLRIILASYRQTLCPFTINKHKSLAGVMEDIFRHIDTEENWTTVKTKICDSLYTVCKPAVTVLKATKTKQEFYSKIVNVYTNEGTQLYMYLNTALRRQEEKAYTPTAKDLGLGPYILMFHLLLMHWKKLVPERGITYRRMLVKDSDCRRYQKGTQFIWMSFVSSSVDLAKAEPFPTCAATGEHKMTFIIDNRNPSR
ncbi:unnamed protein product [Mytilus edulis]|uniref:Uncharacterized protein n=1 Tax=Mytilus edulis TaxID=6550 RepID=A0A8S3RNP2_MYTED|nr:unnamed protein product [Mytilus edulis]